MTAEPISLCDFATAKKISKYLQDNDINAVPEEDDIETAYIRIDPEEDLPTGCIVVLSPQDPDDPENIEGCWGIIETVYDKQEMHVYSIPNNPRLESLDLTAETDIETVAESIVEYLS